MGFCMVRYNDGLKLTLLVAMCCHAFWASRDVALASNIPFATGNAVILNYEEAGAECSFHVVLS